MIGKMPIPLLSLKMQAGRLRYEGGRGRARAWRRRDALVNPGNRMALSSIACEFPPPDTAAPKWTLIFPERRFGGKIVMETVEGSRMTSRQHKIEEMGATKDVASAKRALKRALLKLIITLVIVGVLAVLVFWGGPDISSRRRVDRVKTLSIIDDLSIALANFERDMGGYDVKVGNLEFPTGELKTDEERIRLIRILMGKRMRADGSFETIAAIREDARWNGLYLDPYPSLLKPKQGGRVGQLVDAWHNPLMIRIKRGKHDPTMRHRPESFEVYSWGPNQRDDGGSGDDIANWE